MITKMGMPYEGLAKAGFTGSNEGMRFFVKSYEEGKLTAFVFPEPNSFVNTPEEEKIKEEFEYSKEGVEKVIEWLNKMYDDNKDKWTKAYENRNNAN